MNQGIKISLHRIERGDGFLVLTGPAPKLRPLPPDPIEQGQALLDAFEKLIASLPPDAENVNDPEPNCGDRSRTRDPDPRYKGAEMIRGRFACGQGIQTQTLFD